MVFYVQKFEPQINKNRSNVSKKYKKRWGAGKPTQSDLYCLAFKVNYVVSNLEQWNIEIILWRLIRRYKIISMLEILTARKGIWTSLSIHSAMCNANWSNSERFAKGLGLARPVRVLLYARTCTTVCTKLFRVDMQGWTKKILYSNAVHLVL